MANQSAREMLSRLPVRMAEGGMPNLNTLFNNIPDQGAAGSDLILLREGSDPALYAGSEWAAGLESAAMKAARESGMSQEDYYANLLKAEERILGEIAEDPSSWDVGKAYNAIIESGVSIKDALDAGVKQSTIDAIFASGAPLTAAQLGGGDSAFGAGGRLANESRADYATGAKRILADFMADDYLSPEERRYAQQVATTQGLSLSDIASVGVDPNILFNIPAEEKKPSCPEGYTYDEGLGVCVQDKITPTCPEGYAYDEAVGACMPIAKEEDKDDDTPSCPDGYTYDPVFKACLKDVKDISCPTGYRWDEATQSCVKIFTEVDTDTGSGAESATGVTVYQPLPDNTSVFAPGETSLDTEFRASAPRTEVTEDVMGTQQLTGFDYTPAASLISATGSGFSWTPPTVTGRPRSLMSTDTLNRYTRGRAAQDLRQLVGGNEEAYRAFEPLLSQTGSYGGGLSRSQLFALMQQQASQQAQQEAANYAQFGTRFGEAPPVTGYSEIAQNIGSQNDPMTVKPIDLRYGRPFAEGGEVKKLEGSEELAAEGDTESAGMLANLLRGAKEIPSSIYGYGERLIESPVGATTQLGLDALSMGKAVKESVGDDPIGFLLDMAPVIGEIRSGMDVDKYSDLADEARAAGDTEAARMYEQIVALSMAGAVPLAGMGARAAKRTAKAGIEAAETAATQSARMLDEIAPTTAQVPESPVRVPESGAPVKAQEFVNLEDRSGKFKQVYKGIYPHQGDIKTPEEMVARAERIGPSFQDEIREVTNKLGLEKIETFGVKGLKSLKDKINRNYELETITDPIRTRILINTAEEAENAARMIADKMPSVDRGFQVIPGNGYFDRKLNVMYTGPNGERLLGEIQLVTPEMVRASEGQGHRLYEVERKLIERYGGKENIPQTHIRRFENMQEAQRQLYGGVADQADPKIVEELIPKFKRGGYVAKVGKAGKS